MPVEMSASAPPRKEVDYPYEFDHEARRRAERLRRVRFLFEVFNTGLLVNVVLLLFLLGGWSTGLRTFSESVSPTWYVSAAVYASVFILVFWVVVVTAQAWFRSVMSAALMREFLLGRYMLARVPSLVWGEVIGIPMVLLFYHIVRSFDPWWPLVGLLLSVYVLMAALVFSGDVTLLALARSGREMPPEVKERYSAILASTGRKGDIPLMLFSSPNATSAFSFGIWGGRRIALSEEMVSSLHKNELDVVIAHEIAHHFNRDSVRKALLEVALIWVTVFVLAQILPLSSAWAGMRSASDIATLPLVLLLANAMRIGLTPIAQYYSRRRELMADRYALQVIDDPTAFVSCQKRLADLEGAGYDSSLIERLFFISHPSVRERISLVRGAQGDERH